VTPLTLATPATPQPSPPTIARAVEQLRTAQPRREIDLTELDPPKRLAPYAYCLGGAVRADRIDPSDEDVATGRLILLHDPSQPYGWEGDLRLVTYVTAELDLDLARDPLLPQVGWSWLTDALAAQGATHTALAGTVTQTTSTRFGALAGPAPAADIEIRASWTPIGPDPESTADLAAHALAWCGLLAATAGLPPPGVTALRTGPR
jgi:hypothetical protein